MSPGAFGVYLGGILAVLAVPFAKRLITGDMEGFGRYAFPIVLTCFVIEGCLGTLILLCRKR